MSGPMLSLVVPVYNEEQMIGQLVSEIEAVMQEIGIDISGHTSKHMNEFLKRRVDTVITVCGNTDQACPMFPGQVNRYHWGFEDPARASGTEEEILNVFRRVRDEIKLVFMAYAAGYREKNYDHK